jgi:hypothetical protein
MTGKCFARRKVSSPLIQGTVILAKGKALQLWPERADQGAEVAGIILQVAHCLHSRLAQNLFGDFSHPIKRPHR